MSEGRCWAGPAATGTCDLVTTGRRSGRARSVEIWWVRVDELLAVVGTPGPRSWYANLLADPRATLVLREPPRELAVRAQPVLDPRARRRLAEGAWRAQPWYAEQDSSIEDWVSAAPMVVLHPDPADGAPG